MTDRRCSFLIQIVREYLEDQGYAIRTMPPVFCKWFPPAHLIARREPCRMRYIRIKKVYRRPVSPESASWIPQNESHLYGRFIGKNRGIRGVHCEIWFYSPYRFTWYEPERDRLFGIPPPLIDERCPFGPGGAS